MWLATTIPVTSAVAATTTMPMVAAFHGFQSVRGNGGNVCSDIVDLPAESCSVHRECRNVDASATSACQSARSAGVWADFRVRFTIAGKRLAKPDLSRCPDGVSSHLAETLRCV